jgi:hypothetical protein
MNTRLRWLHNLLRACQSTPPAGDMLVFPMFTGNSLYIKRCHGGRYRNCFRVAEYIGAGIYHNHGTRYWCAEHAPEDARPIPDAMLRGPVREHDCHRTACEVAA